MKYSRLAWLISATACGLIFGLAFFWLNQTTTPTEAQTTENPIKLQENPKGFAFAWRSKEIPIQSANAKFSLDIPESLTKNDWAVAYKTLEKGQPEKMSVHFVSWRKPTDEMDYSQIIGIEDFPTNLISSLAGKSLLAETEYSNKSLMIFIELQKETSVSINQGNKSFELKDSENVLFNGEKSKKDIRNTNDLSVDFNYWKMKSEMIARGHQIIEKGKKNE